MLHRLLQSRWSWVVTLVCALGGLGLSVWASFWRICNLQLLGGASTEGSSCSDWQFDPWWEFWASVSGTAVVLVALLVGRRFWPRASLVIAAVAAGFALSPLPIHLVFDPTGVPVLKG